MSDKYIPFTNLHSHTCMSYFDGLSLPYEHYKYVCENGEDSMAITDHGNMNALTFQLEASKKVEKEFGKKFKNIFGIESYYIPSFLQWRKDYEEYISNKKNKIKKEDSEIGTFIEDEDEKKSSRKIINRKNHLLLLAKNQIGLNNLFRLVSESYRTENFYRYPRIDFEILRKYKEGLICTSSCIGGPIASIYFKNKDLGHDIILEEIRKGINKFLDLFGENWYGELQWNNIEEQHIINQYIIQLSYELGFKCISTCDSHYPRPEQWKDREIYKRLGWLGKSKKPEWINKPIPENVEEIGFELYPKNGLQVWESYKKYSSIYSNISYDDDFIRKTIERTKEISIQQIETFNPENSIKLPKFIVPKDKKPEMVLTNKCIQELKNKGLHTNKEYVSRLKKELHVIKDKNFSEYFLVMEEIAKKANSIMITGVSRGSAGGSLVSYLLGIIQIDPIRWGLQFERFLTKESVGMPDVDYDGSSPVELKELLKKEWGEYSVVQVSNFSTLQIKSLIKDIAKLYEIPFQEVNYVTTNMMLEATPKAKEKHGIEAGVYNPTYEELKEFSPTFRKFIKLYPQIEEHIKVLKGQIRSCFSNKVSILTNNGYKLIEEIKKNYDKIAYLSNTKEIKFNDCYEIFYNGEKEIFIIELEDGSKLELTEDHPVCTKNGYKKVSELLSTDEILSIK